MKPMDILVVDDDLDLAEAIADALEMAGHRPVVAGSGTEAIGKYCDHNFDITFMDVKLPDINGVEAFLTIREMDPTARVVMMTGYRIEHLLSQATEGGAIKVLRKPFAMEEILDTLEEAAPAGLILVVDDDPEFAGAAASLLTEHGYEVLVARNGKEAIEKVLTLNPDLLLLDLRLPVMSGLNVFLELKNRGRVLPTIIVTGYPRDESDAIDVLKSFDVTGCLFKPFEPELLLKAIKNISLEKR